MKLLIVVVFFCLNLFRVTCDEESKRRIVGGHHAKIENIPFLISLRTPAGNPFCGGSIISPKYVLTASHCIAPFLDEKEEIVVVAGTSIADEKDGFRTNVEELIPHEGYEPLSGVNDVALIRIQGEFIYDNKMKEATLASPESEVADGEICIIAGFGATMMRSFSPMLMAEIPIVNHEQCEKVYEHEEFKKVTDKMICTGYDEGQIDTCQGDSGGPLVYQGIQIGIVAFGIGCAQAGIPGVYTKVSAYSDWISSKVNE